MLNQVVMVGRLVKDPEIKKTANGNTVSTVTLAVPRSYKNENGEYDTDFIDCTLWKGIAENAGEYCKKGDLIGIKGRMTTDKDKNGHTHLTVTAEKVTYLAASKSKDEVEHKNLDEDHIDI